eukprot:173573_1
MTETNKQEPANWDTNLTYKILSDRGLVNCYNEWTSVKSAFANNPTAAIKWLKRQKRRFPISHLSHKLINGFIRIKSTIKAYIPLDIQNIILSYCNIFFVKLFFRSDDTKYELRTFDTILKFRTLAKLLQIERGIDDDDTGSVYSSYIHIFLRFKQFKSAYAIQKDHMVVTIHDVQQINEDENRWMELPDGYLGWILFTDAKTHGYEDTLEVGIDIFDKHTDKWTFVNDKQAPSDNIDKWIDSLKIGYIINAKDSSRKWYEAMVRYIVGKKIYVHFIGWTLKFDTIYDRRDPFQKNSLAKRYSKCKKAHVSINILKREHNQLTFGWETKL